MPVGKWVVLAFASLALHASIVGTAEAQRRFAADDSAENADPPPSITDRQYRSRHRQAKRSRDRSRRDAAEYQRLGRAASRTAQLPEYYAGQSNEAYPLGEAGADYSREWLPRNSPDEFYDDGLDWPNRDGNCCSPQRGPIYVRGEYLLWWVKGGNTPPLVTTSPQATPQAQAGVLGQPDTSVLFGDQNVNSGARSGGRLVLGGWIDPTTRIEGSYFLLGQSAQSFHQTSTGDPILGRPFFDVNPTSATPAAQNASLIAYPGVFTGAINVRATSSFQGAELHATHNLCFADYSCDRQSRLDFLVGYRFLRLHENLSISDNITNTTIAASIATNDSFGISNNFNGADLGLAQDYRFGRWCFQSIGRLGLGWTSETVNIAGNNSTVNPAGGLLAQPSNIGNYQRAGFSTVPQLELKLGFDVTDHMRVSVGYDAIYWSRVVRPGDQIDSSLNLSQASGGTLTGAARPAFAFHESDLWVQGLSVGGEYRF